MIEGYRLLQISFESRVMGTRWSRPDSIGIAVERSLGGGVRNMLPRDQIVRVPLPNGCPEFFESFHIGFRQQSTPVWSEAEHQLATAADGFLIDGNQVVKRFQCTFVIRVPEPVPLVQRRIGFYGAPTKIPMTIEHVPVFVWNCPVLIACPSDVTVIEERGICKNKRIWLLDPEGLNNAREVVHVSLAASAIQPELD